MSTSIYPSAVRTAVVALTAALALAATAEAGTTVIYNNTTTFSGSLFSPGGASGGSTDVIIEALTSGGGLSTPVTTIDFNVGSLNSKSLTVDPILFFYGQNANGNGPGAIIADYEFNPVTVASDTVDGFSYGTGSTTTLFTLPAGVFYFGEAFTNTGGASATNAQLNNFGVGLYGPPTVGTASSTYYVTASYGSNPATSTGTLPANYDFGLELIDNTAAVATPEPGTLSMLGLGLLSLGGMVRRKMRKA